MVAPLFSHCVSLGSRGAPPLSSRWSSRPPRWCAWPLPLARSRGGQPPAAASWPAPGFSSFGTPVGAAVGCVSAQRQRYCHLRRGRGGRWAAAPPWPGCQATHPHGGGSAPNPCQVAALPRCACGRSPASRFSRKTHAASVCCARRQPTRCPQGRPRQGKHTPGADWELAPLLAPPVKGCEGAGGKGARRSPLPASAPGLRWGGPAPEASNAPVPPEACQGQRQAGRPGAPAVAAGRPTSAA